LRTIAAATAAAYLKSEVPTAQSHSRDLHTINNNNNNNNNNKEKLKIDQIMNRGRYTGIMTYTGICPFGFKVLEHASIWRWNKYCKPKYTQIVLYIFHMFLF